MFLGQNGDVGNLVGGILTAVFWYYKDLTGAVAGQRQYSSEPLYTDIVQIYVHGGLKLRDFRQVHDTFLTSEIV
jgi:hypothetical protein